MSNAEQSVLGGILKDNNAIDRIDFLKPEMFADARHEFIFRAMLDFSENRRPMDPVTLGKHVGDMAYMGELAMHTPTAANVKAYAEMVRDDYLRRQVVARCGEIIESADDLDPHQLVAKAQADMMALSQEEEKTGDFRDVLNRSVTRLDMRFQDPNALMGLPTGFLDLDDRLLGLQPTDLIILAGRPAMGKTTLAMNIAEKVSRETSVLVFSLEMQDEQLSDRLICARGQIDFGRYRSGRLDDDDWPKVTSAISHLAENSLIIDDRGGLNLNQIRAKARRQKKKGLGLIVIDYLQLITSHSRENRSSQIEEITRGLKALAKELNVPILCLSQLNRGLEQRSNKRPMMADLRDSGSIEQDADVILFVYRDEIYNEDSPDRGVAEIITAKQRQGTTGTDRLLFMGKYCAFQNFSDVARHVHNKESA